MTLIDIMAQRRQIAPEFAPPSCSETVFDLSYPLTSLGRRQNVQCMEEDNEPLHPGVPCFDRVSELHLHTAYQVEFSSPYPYLD